MSYYMMLSLLGVGLSLVYTNLVAGGKHCEACLTTSRRLQVRHIKFHLCDVPSRSAQTYFRLKYSVTRIQAWHDLQLPVCIPPTPADEICSATLSMYSLCISPLHVATLILAILRPLYKPFKRGAPRSSLDRAQRPTELYWFF